MTNQQLASEQLAIWQAARCVSPQRRLIIVGDHVPEPFNDNTSLTELDAQCAAIANELLGD